MGVAGANRDQSRRGRATRQGHQIPLEHSGHRSVAPQTGHQRDKRLNVSSPAKNPIRRAEDGVSEPLHLDRAVGGYRQLRLACHHPAAVSNGAGG